MMGVGTVVEHELDQLGVEIVFNGIMERCKASLFVLVIDVRPSHQKLLHVVAIFFLEVDRKHVLSCGLVFQVDVFRPQTKVHADVVIPLGSGIHQGSQPTRALGVDVCAVIAEHLDGPDLLLVDTDVERRYVTVNHFLVEHVCVTMEEHFCQFDVVREHAIGKCRLAHVRDCVNIGPSFEQGLRDLVGLLVSGSQDQSR